MRATGRPQEEHGHANECAATAVTTMQSNGVAAHVLLLRPAQKEGAIGSSNAVLAAGANIVDYDSPSNLVFPHSTDNNNIRPARTSSPVSNTSGLPSPAPTEDYAHSPAIGVSPRLADMDPPPRRRGRPPGAATPAAAAPVTNRSSSSNHQRQMQSTDNGRLMQTDAYGAYLPPPPRTHQQMPATHPQMPPNQQMSPYGPPPPPPSRPGSAMSILPSSPAQQMAATPNRYAPDVLQDRIETFDQNRSNRSKNSNVDNGRISLLREASYPNVDWFLLALSQIHALTAGRRHKLPEVARSVPQDSWNTLGELVCPNDMVGPNLVAFLAKFPASIETMYTDTISTSYSTYVTAAANFVRELPQKWNRLIEQCRQRGAPPLSQDLAMDLGLGSHALQAVAFRAIARMAYPQPADAGFLDLLEQLHRCDQQTFTQRGLRLPEQKDRIYPLFQTVRNGWLEYLRQKHLYDAGQQQLAPPARRGFPPFEASNCFQVALAVIAGRRAPDPPAPAAGNAPQQAGDHLQQQQQQAMLFNQQKLPHQVQPPLNMPPRSPSTPVPFQPRVNSQSPAQFNMPPRPASAQHNMPPRPPSAQSNMPPRPPSAQHNMPPRPPLTQPFMQPRMNVQSPAQLNGPFAGLPLAPMPPQQHQPGPHLVVPHESDGPRSQPTEPNPTRSALHEAHLRSPVSVPLQIGGETPQLYRYVCEWALSPRPLDKNKATTFYSFDLPQDKSNKIPKTIPSQNPGELPNRVLSEQSQTYRLRCCRLQQDGFPSESEWVTADTYWPEDLYLELNGQELETRLPLHHKKYLPIDLTKFIRPGENKIKVVIHRTRHDPRPLSVAIAVEIVGVVAHSTIIKKVNTEQVIPAAVTKAALQKRLSGTNGRGGDDDEVRATSSSVPVTLFDPFSGYKIFDTPVRGAACKHTDCFDLETFLSQCKRDKEGAPTIVDCWRCPICKRDVRPNKLVKDEWLVQVREQLARAGKLDTRIIMVEPDGSWKPKVERKTGVRSASLEAEERAQSANGGSSGAAGRKLKKVVEVIELD